MLRYLMRIFLCLVALLVAVFWLMRNQSWIRTGSDPSPPAAVTPTSALKPSAPVATLPVKIWTEADYVAYGMPPLASAWDVTTINQATATLREISRHHPLALPAADTDYGKAFFTQLVQTVKRFHLMSPKNKVETYNALVLIYPAFSSDPAKAPPRDKERALLTGLEFELIASFTEDQQFTQDPGKRTLRTTTDLSGNILVARPSSIHFLGSSAMITADVERRVKRIGDPAAFRPEARALALSHMMQHLPIIVQRLNLTSIRPLVEANRAAETTPEVRAYYDTLLTRLP